MKRLTIPGIFWRDHYDRCADQPGERRIIYNGHKRAVVELDDEALANLKNDAEYYSNPNGPCRGEMEAYRSLINSARSMMRSIVRQTA